MNGLPDTVRLRRERIAILAIFVGAVTIAFAPILVRLSELGPMATGFHRFLLAIPLYWLIAATCPGGRRGRRRETENPARLPADRYGGTLSRGGYHGLALLHSNDHSGKFDAAGERRTRLCRTRWLVAIPYAGHRHLSDWAGHRDDGCAHSLRASLSLSEDHFLGDLLGVLTAVFYAAYQMSVERLRKRFSTISIMKLAIRSVRFAWFRPHSQAVRTCFRSPSPAGRS